MNSLSTIVWLIHEIFFFERDYQANISIRPHFWFALLFYYFQEVRIIDIRLLIFFFIFLKIFWNNVKKNFKNFFRVKIKYFLFFSSWQQNMQKHVIYLVVIILLCSIRTTVFYLCWKIGKNYSILISQCNFATHLLSKPQRK